EVIEEVRWYFASPLENEAKFVVEKGREQFVIGSGQMWWHQFQPHTLTRDTGHPSVRQLDPFSCHQRERDLGEESKSWQLEHCLRNIGKAIAISFRRDWPASAPISRWRGSHSAIKSRRNGCLCSASPMTQKTICWKLRWRDLTI